MSGPAALHEMVANMCHGGKIAARSARRGLRDRLEHQLTIAGVFGREMYETWYMIP
jgi:threonine 3-dehydrogenase